jgi:hypothetical protein
MRTSRARSRAAPSVAAALPLPAGALALGAPNVSTDSAPGVRDALRGTRPPEPPPGRTSEPHSTAAVHPAGRDAKGLAAHAAAASDPWSASYGKYPNVGQVQAPFGASQRHLPGRRQERHVPVGDRPGRTEGRPLLRRRERGRLSRRVHRRGGQRHRLDRGAAVPPARCRTRLTRTGEHRTDDAHGPGHHGRRRPEHRFPGRPGPDAARRLARPRRVPHRRHVAPTAPVVAGVQPLARQARHGLPIGFAAPASCARYGSQA